MEIKRMTLNLQPQSEVRSRIDHKSTILTPQKEPVKYFNAHAVITTPKTNFDSSPVGGYSSNQVPRGNSSGPSNYFSIKSLALQNRISGNNLGGFHTANPSIHGGV